MWRISTARNTAPKGSKILIKIHEEFIKTENEGISTGMYVSVSECFERTVGF